MKGLFVALEGIDGSGKTSLLRQLKPALEARGKTVWTTHEPTSRFTEMIEKYPDSYDPVLMFLLFTYDRYLHQKEIGDNLERYNVVITDRYLFSSYAYQGAMLEEYFKSTDYALKWMSEVSSVITVRPDITFYLDISIETALQRIKKYREKDKLELTFDIESVVKFYKAHLISSMDLVDASLSETALTMKVTDKIMAQIS